LSYITQYSPCGHHVSRLKLIAKTTTDTEHPKPLNIWRCECGVIYMEVAGMPFKIESSVFEKMKKNGILKEVEG